MKKPTKDVLVKEIIFGSILLPLVVGVFLTAVAIADHLTGFIDVEHLRAEPSVITVGESFTVSFEQVRKSGDCMVEVDPRLNAFSEGTRDIGLRKYRVYSISMNGDTDDRFERSFTPPDDTLPGRYQFAAEIRAECNWLEKLFGWSRVDTFNHADILILPPKKPKAKKTSQEQRWHATE